MLSSIKLFVCDWDETLTKSDTIGVLAECGYESRKTGGPPLPPWKFFVDGYLQDLQEYKENESKKRQLVVTDKIQRYFEHLPDWIDLSDNLRDRIEYLAHMDKVERASLERIQSFHLFENVTAQEIENKAKQQYQDGILRPGAAEVLCHLIDSDIPVVILSVNWSRLFIRLCLLQYKVPVDKIEIIANEFVVTSEENKSLLTHPLGPILTGLDKAMALQSLQKRYNIDPKHPYTTIYVGDSNTDLLCLLAVERGIIVLDSANSESLLKTCLSIDIPVWDSFNRGHLCKLSNWNDFLNG